MTIRIFVLLFILSSCGNSKNETVDSKKENPNPGTLTIEGHYQGKNLYVQNPSSDDNQFCVTKVVINDSISIEQSILEFSAFEINLKKFGFKKGDALTIVLHHHANCAPKILNQEVN